MTVILPPPSRSTTPWTLLAAAAVMMTTKEAAMSFQVETSSSPVQLSSLHNRQQCHSIFSPLSLSTRRLGCQSELFDLQKISGNSNNNNSCRHDNSRRTISLSAFSEDSSDSDNDEYEVVQRRVVLPPRRVKIRARTASASASTAKNANPNNQRTTKSTTSITTPAATTSTTSSSSSSYSSKIITSRTKSGAPYQHQEMLDHTILSPAEELTFGRQVVRARILRDKIEELILEKQHQKQQEIHQRLQQRRGEELLETEDEEEEEEEEEEDRTTSGNADGHLDYNFLTYELEYLSVYGYCRSSSSRSNNKDTTVAPLPAIRNRNKFEELDNDNDYDDDEEEKEVDRLLLGEYDLHDDLLFEHAMHRSEHYSQLRRRRHHQGDSNGGVLGGDGNTLDDVESRRNNLHQQQRFGPKRTGYRNGSTSSTNRNSYSSLLNIPLHKLDDSDVRMLLESIDIMDGVVVEPAGVTIGTEGETNNGRVVLVNILLDGSYARETLMRRNVKLVMSIAKNWMRNSFTTANSNNNNIPGDSGGGGGSGSGSSGKRGGDKSSKRYLAQMYEGSWDKPSLDEAVQEGMLGLARAVDKFDPERGLRFSTYATHWVTSYVRVCFQRAVTGCLRVPSQLHDIRSAYNQIVKDYLHLGSTPPAQESIAQQLNISEQRLHTAIRATGTLLSVDAPVMSGGSSGNYKGSMAGGDGRNSQELMLLDTLKCAEPRPEDQVEISFLRQCLENAMATELTPYERDILRLRLGLDSGEGKTVREIVELSGNIVSMADVRSTERRAFKKLRSPSSVHTHNLLAYLDLASIEGGRER